MLTIEHLEVDFVTADGPIRAVRGIDLALAPGETVGIVGESGSGKSQTFLAAMGLLPDNARTTGRVRFDGQDLLAMPAHDLDRLRGRRIAMIFQDPMTALNPYLTIARQMTEVPMRHLGLDAKAARARAVAMLERVRLPDAARRIDDYPHAFSGGMRQRVMIAMALLCQPDLVIADEPTTALDVTVQAQILALFAELRRDFGMAMVLISHDLGVVAGLADRVVVMYAGRIVEFAPVDDLFARPRHPYTHGLLRAMPDMAGATAPAAIPGQPPSPGAPDIGCAFAPRCATADDRCRRIAPVLAGGVACHRPLS